MIFTPILCTGKSRIDMAKTRVSINLKGLKTTRKEVRAAVEEAIEIIGEDFIRTSSEAAPKDKGVLEDSHSYSAAWQGDSYNAVIDYSVKEENGNHGFDYAEYIHESDYYNLGENSLQKADGGGATGMSGKTYEVDRRFMSRVIEGEQEAYTQVVEDLVKDACK
jgi:hypothetical protein